MNAVLLHGRASYATGGPASPEHELSGCTNRSNLHATGVAFGPAVEDEQAVFVEVVFAPDEREEVSLPRVRGRKAVGIFGPFEASDMLILLELRHRFEA